MDHLNYVIQLTNKPEKTGYIDEDFSKEIRLSSGPRLRVYGGNLSELISTKDVSRRMEDST